jgi:hypothetical protein
VTWRGVLLDYRVEGYDVKTTEYADHQQVEHDTPVCTAGEKTSQAGIHGRLGGAGKVHINTKQGQTDGAEWYQADLNLTAGQAFAQ